MDDHIAFQFLHDCLSAINQLTPVAGTFGTARVVCGQPVLSDFNGLIRLSNRLDGFLCIAFPRSTVDRLIANASDRADAHRNTVIQELTNRLASQFARNFSEQVKVSVPMFMDDPHIIQTKLPYLRFVLPIRFGDHSASLILALKPVLPGDKQ